MPSKGTKVRAFRLSDDDWRAAQAVAKARGENLSDVIRDALKRYVMRHTPKP